MSYWILLLLTILSNSEVACGQRGCVALTRCYTDYSKHFMGYCSFQGARFAEIPVIDGGQYIEVSRSTPATMLYLRLISEASHNHEIKMMKSDYKKEQGDE